MSCYFFCNHALIHLLSHTLTRSIISLLNFAHSLARSLIRFNHSTIHVLPLISAHSASKLFYFISLHASIHAWIQSVSPSQDRRNWFLVSTRIWHWCMWEVSWRRALAPPTANFLTGIRSNNINADLSSEASFSNVVNWLFGLVAWFSLQVREFLGSIPRTALLVNAVPRCRLHVLQCRRYSISCFFCHSLSQTLSHSFIQPYAHSRTCLLNQFSFVRSLIHVRIHPLIH